MPCDYSDAYILIKGMIKIAGKEDTVAETLLDKKKKIFKNCMPFIDRISEINNKQVDDVKYLDIVTLMYNLIEYSDNYQKTSGSYEQLIQ